MTPIDRSGPRCLDDLSPEEVVKACELNYIDYWRSATAASDGEWSEVGGILRCVTGLHQEIFNVVLCCRLSKESAPACIDRAIAEFRGRKIPMIWHVGRTTTPEDLGSYLEERGFPHDYDLIAMAADLSGPLEPVRVPGDVSVRKCTTTNDRNDWIDCLTRSWDSPGEVGEWMRANPFFSERRHPSFERFSDRVMYIGLLNGIPSGAVMLLTSRGVAGLQCVGTVASAQKKGVGEAMVRTALLDASAKGHRFVVVLSTTEGVPLYRKTGFKEFGKLPEHSLYFDRLLQ